MTSIPVSHPVVPAVNSLVAGGTDEGGAGQGLHLLLHHQIE